MEFGVSTSSRQGRIAEAYIDEMRAAGVTVFEIGQRPVFVDPADTEQHRRIRDHLDATGCRFHSIHTGYTLPYTMTHSDPEMREETLRQAREAAGLIVALGGDVVVVHAGGGVKDVQDMDEFTERAVEGAPRIVEAVTDQGARVAFENANPNGFPNDPEVHMSIVEMFPPEQAGVCLDTGHAHFSGWDERVIERAAGRIISTHLHDNNTERDEHVKPGLGTIDWVSYMDAFRRAGYPGPWIFECGPPDDYSAPKAVLKEAWER